VVAVSRDKLQGDLTRALKAQYPGQADKQAAALAWIAVYLHAYIYSKPLSAFVIGAGIHAVNHFNLSEQVAAIDKGIAVALVRMESRVSSIDLKKRRCVG
jgi:hypothetical protein